MAYCMNCGRQIPEGAKFCPDCGAATGEIKTEAPKNETVYEGEVHKCPNCGDIIDAYETVCEACGYEIRGRDTVSTVKELAAKLELLDDPQKKEEMICNFYIPNTKEDIYEFFILATSNIKVGSGNTKAWFAKLEQAYQKAQLTLGNTKEFEHFKALYLQAKKTKTINLLFSLMKSAYFWALIFVVVGVIILAIGFALDSEFALVGMLLLFGGGLIAEVKALNKDDNIEENQKKKPKEQKVRKNGTIEKNTTQSLGKNSNKFLLEYYEDVAEELRELGFDNILLRPEKKRLSEFSFPEGAIKGISVAGNTKFSANDEFDLNSKIIIRYYSKNC